jgi:hypothetical protein
VGIKSWKREFLAVSASKAAEDSWLKALLHSRKKWTGFLPENLAKHKLTPDSVVHPHQVDGSSTCALCLKAVVEYKRRFTQSICSVCPLAKARGPGKTCCDQTGTSANLSPYLTWRRKDDPEPMIKLIDKAIAQVKLEEGGLVRVRKAKPRAV